LLPVAFFAALFAGVVQVTGRSATVMRSPRSSANPDASQNQMIKEK
jgi:hypothetical protein